jgi:hypothetical protein
MDSFILSLCRLTHRERSEREQSSRIETNKCIGDKQTPRDQRATFGRQCSLAMDPSEEAKAQAGTGEYEYMRITRL